MKNCVKKTTDKTISLEVISIEIDLCVILENMMPTTLNDLIFYF